MLSAAARSFRLERDPGIDPTVAAADHGLVEYWTIEVLDGAFTALRWRESHGDALVEAAYTNQALDWRWTHHAWGVALELGFAHEGLWGQFRALPTVQAALDAVPDPQGRPAGLLRSRRHQRSPGPPTPTSSTDGRDPGPARATRTGRPDDLRSTRAGGPRPGPLRMSRVVAAVVVEPSGTP